MKKVFCLLKTTNQYLMLVIMCINGTVSAQTVTQNDIKFLYKNHNKSLFRNSLNQSLSIEKNSQFNYYLFQKNEYSVRIIKSPLKTQTIFNKIKDGYEYNIVLNHFPKNNVKEIGLVAYKVEKRFYQNNSKCESFSRPNFTKLTHSMNELNEVDFRQFFDFTKCDNVDEGVQRKFINNFKNFLNAKINEIVECEKNPKLEEIKSANQQIYARFTGYANQLVDLTEDLKVSNRKTKFVCDNTLKEEASIVRDNDKQVINFRQDSENLSQHIGQFDKILNVIFNHELIHSPTQEKNKCVSEASVEVISKLCHFSNQEIAKYEKADLCNEIKGSKSFIGSDTSFSSSLAKSNEQKEYVELNSGSQMTDAPTALVRNQNRTAAANLARTAQAEVSEIPAIADRIAAQVSEYPNVNPTNQQPSPPLSDSTRGSVNTAMSSLNKIGDGFSAFIDKLSNQSAQGLAQAAVAGGAGAAAIGIAQQALKPTASSDVAILNTKGVESQLNPFQPSSDFNKPAATDQIVDPATLAQMNALASKSMNESSKNSADANQKVDTTRAQIATVNTTSTANGMAALQNTSADGKVSESQARTIAAVGSASPINIQQPQANVVTSNSAVLNSSKVARLLTDTRMNSLKGDNYKIITRYYGEEQFANVLKDRKTVVIDKDNNRIVGDAVSARNCFQDTGAEIVKLKACPQK